MTYGISRTIGGFASTPRKRFTACIVISIIIFITLMISARVHMPGEEKAENIAVIQTHLQFLNSLYRARQEDILVLQNKYTAIRDQIETDQRLPPVNNETAMSPELRATLKNISGTKAALGVRPKSLQLIRTPFVFQLLPHLMNNPHSLHPLYHMKSSRAFVDVVVGIPTVKRDKERYLLITLTHLVRGLTPNEANSTLIVVFVGETDLEYVVNTAKQIESMFPKHVENGLIEVLAPSQSYYPDFDAVEKTLGDSLKRVKWRTKQNLDAIYLMSYAQTKGTYYLMLEDDVIARKNYIREIKQFNAATTVATPNWFFIEYCHVGGIGKVFRSSDLIHFIVYVQLFYKNMPIDWLLESYLADRVCGIDKTSKDCGKSKSVIRPKYKTSLFKHIGIYSSLKGKIQKVKDTQFGSVPSFYPHDNPPLDYVKTDIHEEGGHTLKKAYEGETYFWGLKPKKGNIVEFRFKKPAAIKSFIFRSSNVEHPSDRFYDTDVEALHAGTNNYTVVGTFDEFGLAEGELKKESGTFDGIRLRVKSDSFYWAILSEIEIITHGQTGGLS